MIDQIVDREKGSSVRGKLNTLIDAYNGDLTEPSDRTIYVETTGNDVTGDGSIGNPFATIKRALDDIQLYMLAIITIQLGSGTFTWDDDCVIRFGRIKMLSNSRLYLNGETPTAVVSGLTLSAQVGKEWTYDVTGATFTIDEHNEHWLYDGSEYCPIIENGTDTIGSFLDCAGSGKSIYQLNTTVNFTMDTFGFPADIFSGQVRVQFIIMDFGTDVMKTKHEQVYTILKECTIKANGVEIGFDFPYHHFLFNHVYIITTTWGVAFKTYFRSTTIHGGAIRCTNKAIEAVSIAGGRLNVGELLIKNASYGICVQEGSIYFGNYSEGFNTTFIDCTYAFSLYDLCSILCSAGNYKVYIDNVNYVCGHRAYLPYYEMVCLIGSLKGTPNTGNLTSHLNSLSPPNYNANIVIT